MDERGERIAKRFERPHGRGRLRIGREHLGGERHLLGDHHHDDRGALGPEVHPGVPRRGLLVDQCAWTLRCALKVPAPLAGREALGVSGINLEHDRQLALSERRSHGQSAMRICGRMNTTRPTIQIVAFQ